MLKMYPCSKRRLNNDTGLHAVSSEAAVRRPGRSSSRICGQRPTPGTRAAPSVYLCMLYLQLGHLDQVLPEGHHTPGFEAGQLCGEHIGREKRGKDSNGDVESRNRLAHSWTYEPLFPDSESLSNFRRQCFCCSSAWGTSLLFSRALSSALLEFS